MKWVEEFEVEVYTATQIANMVPWHGHYIRVEDFEMLLDKLVEESQDGSIRATRVKHGTSEET